MMQLFILDALEKHAEQVAKTPLPRLREAFGPDSFIHPDAWHACARELRDELNLHLKK